MMVIHHMNKLIDLGFYLSFILNIKLAMVEVCYWSGTFNSLNTLIVL
ncbi:hypothetical protein BANRA_04087 [Klebsiella pneumoniae]|nr:hypothetical protein BANRA_04087 [Klebsiella pneumoniae]